MRYINPYFGRQLLGSYTVSGGDGAGGGLLVRDCIAASPASGEFVFCSHVAIGHLHSYEVGSFAKPQAD